MMNLSAWRWLLLSRRLEFGNDASAARGSLIAPPILQEMTRLFRNGYRKGTSKMWALCQSHGKTRQRHKSAMSRRCNCFGGLERLGQHSCPCRGRAAQLTSPPEIPESVG